MASADRTDPADQAAQPACAGSVHHKRRQAIMASPVSCHDSIMSDGALRKSGREEVLEDSGQQLPGLVLDPGQVARATE